MRIYLYDLVNHNRLLEFRLVSFTGSTLTAQLTENYIAGENDNPMDLGFLAKYDIGMDFSDGSNNGRCNILRYNQKTGRAMFEIKVEELKNRRKYLRVPVMEEFELTITKPSIRHLSILMLDISYGGFKFRTLRNLEDGQDITLEIPTATNTIHLDGRIVDKQKSGTEYVYRVIFQDIELNGSLGNELYTFITSRSRVAV